MAARELAAGGRGGGGGGEAAIAVRGAAGARPPGEEESVYRLSTFRECPDWLVRPGIVRGYRVRFSARLCALSLFRLHNETLNVWSHLAAAPLFVVLLAGAAAAVGAGEAGQGPAALPLLVFHAAAVTCFALSAAFHLFGCRCHRTHERLLRCDLGGICALILGSYLPGIHYGFYCFPVARSAYTALMAAGCALGAALPALRWSLARRQAFYTALVGFAVVPILHWMLLAPYEEPEIAAARGGRLAEVLAMLAWYAAGAAFYFTGFPESRWPGRFDVWMHSHTLWHLCVVAAALTWRATLLDMHREAAGRTCDLPGLAAAAAA